jgi:hypothetical protein
MSDMRALPGRCRFLAVPAAAGTASAVPAPLPAAGDAIRGQPSNQGA